MTLTPLPESPLEGTVKDMRLSQPRPHKRRCSLPITPPATPDHAEISDLLDRAVNVLTTEATALSFVSRLYQTDPVARSALVHAVDAVVEASRSRSKLIVCGVGKSAYVAMKIVATMKSLGVYCAFLHAAEALHGDLGDVRAGDVVMFVTFSGKTAELVNVATHLPLDVTVMALTAHPDAETCPLLCSRPGSILLPAPIHESETSSFGVSAPTTSTTVAMAIGDMLALTAADLLHQGKSSAVFLRNHPGGSIGAAQVAAKQS